MLRHAVPEPVRSSLESTDRSSSDCSAPCGHRPQHIRARAFTETNRCCVEQGDISERVQRGLLGKLFEGPRAREMVLM